MALIFSYGSLQLAGVQVATFGRELSGTPDELPRYETSAVRIDDPKIAAAIGRTQHANVLFNGRDDSTVLGMAFEVTDAELETADRYEASASYRRIRVTLASGREAWVYFHDPQRAPRSGATASAGQAPDIPKQYRARRRRTWRATRLWVVIAAVGMAGGWIGEDRWEEWVVAIFFMMAFAGIVAIVLLARKHYRCPACEEVLSDSDGISLFPSECPRCHVRLS